MVVLQPFQHSQPNVINQSTTRQIGSCSRGLCSLWDASSNISQLGIIKTWCVALLQSNSKLLICSHKALSSDPQPDLERNPEKDDGGLSPQVELPGNIAVQAVDRNEMAQREDDDGDVVAGPAVEASVTLAKTSCKCF